PPERLGTAASGGDGAGALAARARRRRRLLGPGAVLGRLAGPIRRGRPPAARSHRAHAPLGRRGRRSVDGARRLPRRPGARLRDAPLAGGRLAVRAGRTSRFWVERPKRGAMTPKRSLLVIALSLLAVASNKPGAAGAAGDFAQGSLSYLVSKRCEKSPTL